MSKHLAIIPARGGSKGIPRKNLKQVGGRPLLSYTIEQAQLSALVSRVVVSTDDPEIAAVAREWDAEVIWRPAEISGDESSSEAALLHVLDYTRDVQSYHPDLVVFLQATSPMRGRDDIDKAIVTLRNQDADSLFSACPVQGFIWRQEGLTVSSLSYDYRDRQRRQDAPQDLIENGSIYVFRPWVLRKHNNRLGGKIAVYRMSVLDSWQVDEEDDLLIVEGLKGLRRSQSNKPIPKGIQLLAIDFDGVMTDNRVLLDEEGKESVWCNRSDGWGIERLKKTGLEIIVISTEINQIVSARCQKLGIRCVQACSEKLPVLKRIAAERRLGPEQIIYIGNDENDLDCMRWVGFPVAVADAEPTVRRVASMVTERGGGKGAVREVCDLIISRRALKEEFLSASSFGASP